MGRATNNLPKIIARSNPEVQRCWPGANGDGDQYE